MSERDQVKPLTPSSFTNSSRSSHNDQEAILTNDRLKARRRRNYVQCCGCITAIVLIIVVTFLIFSFTVYNVKVPQLNLNSVTFINSTPQSNNYSNITLIADVSVKNPNLFTFRFGSSTTLIYYKGTKIGEVTSPPGKAKGRKTLRLNVTVEIMMKMGEKDVNISSFTKLGGKVKVLNLINRKVEVHMNCNVVYNMTSGSTHGKSCFAGDAF